MTKRLDKAPPFFVDPRAVSPAMRRNLSLQNEDVWIIRDLTKPRAGGGNLRGGLRTLDEKNPVTRGKTGEKLLRPLPHPVPPQMGMDDDRIAVLAAARDGMKRALFSHAHPNRRSVRGRLSGFFPREA